MFRDSVIAAIRTGVAFGVTWLLANLLNLGVEIDTDTAAALSVVGFGLAVAAYNFVVGLLERRVNPYFGILLGVPKAPKYGQVGTQTSPPVDPLVGDPAVDNGAARDERGNTTVIGAGLIALVVGIVLAALTRYDQLGNVLVTIGVIVLIVGVVLAVVYRGRGSRL